MEKPDFCPLCKKKRFVDFPVGWDGHAEYKCDAIPKNIDGKKRKQIYKKRLKIFFKK